ncbi:RNA splicing factor [Lithospermum erythrorhizon]|uniref:RNA splicing factor n=1 Tax=Lithospermum erythrorhizon TaxID=34254 RepID=A0AAV3Q0U2_LITER
MALCRKIQLKRIFYNPLVSNAILQEFSLSDVICKVLDRRQLIKTIFTKGYAQKCNLGEVFDGRLLFMSCMTKGYAQKCNLGKVFDRRLLIMPFFTNGYAKKCTFGEVFYRRLLFRPCFTNGYAQKCNIGKVFDRRRLIMPFFTNVYAQKCNISKVFDRSPLSMPCFQNWYDKKCGFGKVFYRRQLISPCLTNGYTKKCNLGRFLGGSSVRYLCTPVLSGEVKCDENVLSGDGSGEVKKKRKKLKGKRAVVKWLKFFRWKKKKEFDRMTAEERILYKLTKARRKEERLLEALNKIEPKEKSETSHDPEILTPEEHFYFLKMGQKCKNYVPVGRRGIYQGVILNMHLHWKKHQTLQVIVKTFSPEEVIDIAVELARLSGGIVLHIQDNDTIIMYRGKNYAQPPTEIMSPRCTLPRKKALDKSKYRDALRAVRKHIPRLEQGLELLRAQAETMAGVPEDKPTDADNDDLGCPPDFHFKNAIRLKELIAKTELENEIDDSESESVMGSDSEELSDIFETESDRENDDGDDEKEKRHLYLDQFEKFPAYSNEETEDFEDHLRQISTDSRKEKSRGKGDGLPDLDEVDRMVLRAASLLKKKRR